MWIYLDVETKVYENESENGGGVRHVEEIRHEEIYPEGSCLKVYLAQIRWVVYDARSQVCASDLTLVNAYDGVRLG